MPNDAPTGAGAESLPVADITDTMFIATPRHWNDLAVRGIRFRISHGDKPIALLSPVEVNPNGIGAVE